MLADSDYFMCLCINCICLTFKLKSTRRCEATLVDEAISQIEWYFFRARVVTITRRLLRRPVKQVSSQRREVST